MKEKIKYLINKKSFHICMVIVIIAVILFGLGLVVLKYNVEGETNMPFKLGKVRIVSSSEGVDKDPGENRWAFNVNQNNDFYIYIEKNKEYNKNEAIKSVVIDNISVQKNQEKGIINYYRPNISEQGGIFSNTEENLIQSIEYTGAMETDQKSLKISNQGGLIIFRYANDKIAEYASNDEEINHMDLLKKSGVSEDELKAKLKEISKELGENYDSMEAVIETRKQARADKNWDLADKIRVALDKVGIVLKDSKEGTTWEVK